MDDGIFQVASQYARWLAVRQNAIAYNVANANTPDFIPRDTEPFSVSRSEPRTVDREGAEVLYSGNGVDLDQELLNAAEVSRAQTLNSAVLKAFHRMVISSIKE